MTPNVITPEWLSELCTTLDGTETSVTNDRIKQNAIIQNTSNRYYDRLRRATMADSDHYTDEEDES